MGEVVDEVVADDQQQAQHQARLRVAKVERDVVVDEVPLDAFAGKSQQHAQGQRAGIASGPRFGPRCQLGGLTIGGAYVSCVHGFH